MGMDGIEPIILKLSNRHGHGWNRTRPTSLASELAGGRAIYLVLILCITGSLGQDTNGHTWDRTKDRRLIRSVLYH